MCGTIDNLHELGRLCKEHDIIFIVDAAQTAGLIDIDMKADHIDILTFTGHKSLLGPQGIGGFLIRADLAQVIDPLIAGGMGSFSDSDMMPCTMPELFEAGTPNLVGIIGLGPAHDYIESQTTTKMFDYEMELALYFLKSVNTIPNVNHISIPNLSGSCPIVAIDFIGLANALVSYHLENDYNITTRCGMHCAYLAHQTLGTYPRSCPFLFWLQ